MLFELGRITINTPAAALVHDRQLLTEKLDRAFDTVADVVFTPTQTISVENPHKPTCGMSLIPICTKQFPRFRSSRLWDFDRYATEGEPGRLSCKL